MEFHELANLFPLMSSAEMNSLRDDIKKNGLLEPITVYEGKVLDGRNRYTACELEGVVQEYEDYKETIEPLAYVLSKNLERRHLSKDQQACLAVEVLPLLEKQALDRKLKGTQNHSPILGEGRSDEQAGKLAGGVGKTYVSDAKRISREEPIIFEEIKQGKKTLQEAKREIVKKNVKQPERVNGKYRVIYADPPWRYGNDISSTKCGTSPQDIYPTMSIDELCALEIPAEDNAVLFLWVTSPLLEDAFEVIKAWGFKYKSSFVWNKLKHNFGYYNSVRHEFLLVCTKGSCLPEIKELSPSVVEIERTKHSEKPEYFRELIDKLYPNGNRIELFARKKYPNWDTYGNQL